MLFELFGQIYETTYLYAYVLAGSIPAMLRVLSGHSWIPGVSEHTIKEEARSLFHHAAQVLAASTKVTWLVWTPEDGTVVNEHLKRSYAERRANALECPDYLQRALRYHRGDQIRVTSHGDIEVLKAGEVVRTYLSIQWIAESVPATGQVSTRPGCSLCGTALRGNWCPECDPRELLHEL